MVRAMPEVLVEDEESWISYGDLLFWEKGIVAI